MSDLEKLGREIASLRECAILRMGGVLVLGDKWGGEIRMESPDHFEDCWVEGYYGAPGDDGLHDDHCPGSAYPDLSDPCTLGGLLGLVREAWEGKGWWSGGLVTPQITTKWENHYKPGWRVTLVPGVSQELFESEAEALVRALQAAPEPSP